MATYQFSGSRPCRIPSHGMTKVSRGWDHHPAPALADWMDNPTERSRISCDVQTFGIATYSSWTCIATTSKKNTSTFPQCKGNSAIACRGELLDSTTVQDASTASVKCRQSTSKHIAQATKAKTQSCPASLLFNILKRFSSPKASNSTALEPSDAGKVPVLGQSLAAGHQGLSCTGLKVEENLWCPARAKPCPRTGFVRSIGHSLERAIRSWKMELQNITLGFQSQVREVAISQLYFEKCQQSAAALCVPLELEIPLSR